MNNIYFDKLPETIAKSSNEDDVNTTEVRMWFNSDVKISSLTDRLAEERKKVVQEIKTLLKEYVDIDVNIDYKDCNYRTITDYGLKKILDQIEGASDARTNK